MVMAIFLSSIVTAEDFKSQHEVLKALNEKNRVFTLEEAEAIKSVRFENAFQKKLAQITVYSRTSSEEGLRQAINLAEDTLSSNNVKGWRKQILQIQIVFIYQLLGDNDEQKKGIGLALDLLNQDEFSSLDEIDDHFVKSLIRWGRHSSNTLRDVLLEKVGYHYLDEEQKLEEAKRYFTKIKSPQRRKKNLDQISMRMGKIDNISRVVAPVAPTQSKRSEKRAKDLSRTSRKQVTGKIQERESESLKNSRFQYVALCIGALVVMLLFWLVKKTSHKSP